jgi:hypothetical protein
MIMRGVVRVNALAVRACPNSCAIRVNIPTTMNIMADGKGDGEFEYIDNPNTARSSQLNG